MSLLALEMFLVKKLGLRSNNPISIITCYVTLSGWAAKTRSIIVELLHVIQVGNFIDYCRQKIYGLALLFNITFPKNIRVI